MTTQSNENVKPKHSRFVGLVVFVVLMIVAQLPAITGLSVIGSSVASGNNLDTVLGLSLVFVTVSVLAIWLIRKYYLSITYANPRQAISKRDVTINIGWFVLARIIIAVCSALSLAIFNEQQSQNDKQLFASLEKVDHLSFDIVLALVVFFISITFVAPYLEELVFRGIFKETLFSKFSFTLPLVITSLVFSANHASTNMISFVMYALMGAIFYLAYNRRGNVRDSMMVHMLNNGIASVIMIGYVIVTIVS